MLLKNCAVSFSEMEIVNIPLAGIKEKYYLWTSAAKLFSS
jgi:hypothetical protein